MSVVSGESSLNGWKVAGASVCGTNHVKNSKPCQDAHLWNALTTDILLIAIADGAGSAAYSEIGSRIAAQTAIDEASQQNLLLAAHTDEDYRSLLKKCIEACQQDIDFEAAKLKVPSRELATTLIVAVVTPCLIAVAQIGDGALVICDDSGEIMALTSPKIGEYINETTFITSSDALKEMQFVLWEGKIKQVALFSDGLQSLALTMPEGTPYKPFFSPLFQFIATVDTLSEAQERLLAFLSSSRVQERSDDDLTLLLAQKL